MTLLLLAGLATSTPALATECVTTSPPGRIPAAQLVVLAEDATATSTFCGGTAGYSSDVYFDGSSGDVYLGTGNVTASGTEYDLGVISSGDELIFYIYVRNTGYTYYSGPGERNPDGIVHAAVTDLGGGRFHIGFEDLFGGGDLDYDDVNLVIETTGIAVADNDTDDDGVDDEDDNCLLTANADQADGDGDFTGDACDVCPDEAYGVDSDEDGTCDGGDNCADDENADQADADADGAGDVCDICPNDADDDLDLDGWCADEDNCPADANDQSDADGDGFGDVCDTCPLDAADDADGDGVCGDEDMCADTVLPDEAPTSSLGTNRFADLDGDGVFDTVSPRGRGPGRSYTIQDTAGCSCAQIVDELALGDGHMKFGCSISAMDDWTALVE